MSFDTRPRFNLCQLGAEGPFRYFGVMCCLGTQPVAVRKAEEAAQAHVIGQDITVILLVPIFSYHEAP